MTDLDARTLAAFPAGLRARYRPTAILGEGSFGVVFRAEDTALYRDVAVKVFRAAPTGDARRRFLREVRALGTFEHPNVVRIFDADVGPQGAWIVMEMLEGGAADSVTPPDPLAFARDIATGLQALHDHGLLHRDLKPANFFVTRQGRGVLLDLGLVADPRATALTATGALVGTLRYLAPELFRGEPAGRASDWYAWGASIYELLEGCRLRDEVPVEDWIAGQDIPFPGFLALDARSGPAQAIRACVAYDPTRRPQDLAALDRLWQAPAESAIPAAPEPPPGRRPWVPAAAAVALLLGLGLAWPGGEPPPGPPPRPAPLVDHAEAALAALGERDALDPIPHRYFRKLGDLEGFEALLEGLEAAPDLAHLDPELRRRLEAFDDALAARGALPVFGPAITSLPEDAPPYVPAAPGSPSYRGWMAESLRHSEAANQALEAGLDHLMARPEEELLEVPTILTMRILGRPGAHTLFSLPASEENGHYLVEMMRPAAAHTHRALVAALRAVDEVPGPEGDRRLVALWWYQARLDPIFLSELAGFPPWLLFGGTPRSPAGWLLVGRKAVIQALVFEEAGADASRLRALARRALVAAQPDSEPLPGGERSQLASEELFRVMARFRDRAGWIDQVGRLRGALRDRPAAFRPQLILEVGQAILELVTRGELPPGELEVLERALVAWREAHPDVPGWASPDALLREVRKARGGE